MVWKPVLLQYHRWQIYKMMSISKSVFSFVTAYAGSRNLNHEEALSLQDFFVAQYFNAPLYVKIFLNLYFHFIGVICFISHNKGIGKLKKDEFRNFFESLSASKFVGLRKITLSVRSLLEFKILELHDVQ